MIVICETASANNRINFYWKKIIWIKLWSFFYIFIPISIGKKVYYLWSEWGWNLKNNRDRYSHVYIFLIRKKKENFFEKCLSVRPSVRPCAKVMYTKTQERIKIIECGLKGVYWESKLPKFRPERTKAYEVRAEWNF